MIKVHEKKENNKLDENDLENEEEDEMTSKRKRLHNPKTKSYYEIRQRTTKYGKKGQIKGKWKKKK